MAEMSTLNGYELVDSKLREDIDNLRVSLQAPSCEDRLYEVYGIDKTEFPYVFIWVAPNFSYNRPAGNGDAYSRLVFSKQIEHVYGNYTQGYMLYHTNYYVAGGYDFPGDWNYNDEDITNDVIDKLCEVYPNLSGPYSSRDYASPVGAGLDGNTYLYINKIDAVIPSLSLLTYYDLSTVDYGGTSSNLFAGCIPFPVNEDGSINYGTDGQILVTNADGTTAWSIYHD